MEILKLSKMLLSMVGAVILCTQLCYGQTSLDTLLTDYARPDFRRSALNLLGSTSGSIAYDKHASSERPASMSMFFSASYSSRNNSRQWQHHNFASSDVSVSVAEGSRSRLQNTMEYSGSTRHFVKPNRYYAAYNDVATVYTGISDDTDRFSASAFNDFGFGFGRVELLDDVVHASRLIDMLDCAGVLLREVNEEHILILADTIATMKNSRFFDSRLQRVREQEAVASLLSEWGYIAGGNFFSYAVLMDAYRFERAFWSARSGSSVEFLVGRDFLYSTTDGWGSSDDLRLTISYHDHRIKSQYLSTELSIENELSYRRARGDISRDRYISDVVFEYNVTYSPTNRVVWTLRNTLNVSVDMLDSQMFSSSIFTAARGNVNGTVDYYFSPRLRLGGSSSFSARTSHFDSGQSTSSSSLIDFNFNVQMIYSYF